MCLHPPGALLLSLQQRCSSHPPLEPLPVRCAPPPTDVALAPQMILFPVYIDHRLGSLRGQ